MSLSCWVCTYDHSESDFLPTLLFLDSLVQHNVQEDVVATKDANNLAAAVELDKQSLVEILM